MADYPHAQWFEALQACRVCGKPAGVLRSFYGNNALAYMCKAHAEKEIKAAHRKGNWLPDDVLKERAATPVNDAGEYNA